jgi:hypothetical protein
VTVEVKITDQGHLDTHPVQAFTNFGHGAGGIFGIDRDTNQLRTRPGQLSDLQGGGHRIGGIGVGHGLHHDGGVPADDNLTYPDRHRTTAIDKSMRIGHKQTRESCCTQRPPLSQDMPGSTMASYAFNKSTQKYHQG